MKKVKLVQIYMFISARSVRQHSQVTLCFLRVIDLNIKANLIKIQCRGFRTTAHGILFLKTDNDLMTINRFEVSQHIWFMLKGIISQQKLILFY